MLRCRAQDLMGCPHASALRDRPKIAERLKDSMRGGTTGARTISGEFGRTVALSVSALGRRADAFPKVAAGSRVEGRDVLRDGYLERDLVFRSLDDFDLSLRARSCRIRLALSSSRLREAGRFLPARLMKYWIMRIPDPIPFGLTFLLAMTLATVSASWLKVSRGGKVETVFTRATHRLLAVGFLLRGLFLLLGCGAI
jgi:hypothetical protein